MVTTEKTKFFSNEEALKITDTPEGELAYAKGYWYKGTSHAVPSKSLTASQLAEISLGKQVELDLDVDKSLSDIIFRLADIISMSGADHDPNIGYEVISGNEYSLLCSMVKLYGEFISNNHKDHPMIASINKLYSKLEGGYSACIDRK